MAQNLIKGEVSDHSVVMSSFGKDSMVLLDLIRSVEFKLPVLFFREPFFPKKYEFANRVILDNDYVVYDYPPMRTALMKVNGQVEVINFYQVGTENEYIYLPTGISPPQKGEEALCGLDHLLAKPTGTFRFPWDTILIGHKSSDHDPMFGDVKLKMDVARAGPVKLVLPLKDFTDEDIWEYHRVYNLPIHSSRYDSNNGWKEHKDLTSNPDYFPACVRCIDRDEGRTVFCPKLMKRIGNISGAVEYLTVNLPEYIER